MECCGDEGGESQRTSGIYLGSAQVVELVPVLLAEREEILARVKDLGLDERVGVRNDGLDESAGRRKELEV